MTDTTQKPLHVIAHELLTGKPCERVEKYWAERDFTFAHWYCEGSFVPHYDSDISAAWRLVEAMKACEGVSVKTATSKDRGDYCGVYGALPESRRHPGYIVRRMAICYAESMPLAITMAFVEACKLEESE